MSLRVPQPSKYVTLGKAYVVSPRPPVTFTCRLVAGGDFDQTMGWVFSPDDAEPLTLSAVHEFAGAGNVDFRCSRTSADPDARANASFIRITAIRVGTLTNTSY